jgi:hypothetical protein
LATKRWQSRWRTAQALKSLARARLEIAVLPFARWRGSLGYPAKGGDTLEARLWASHVEWAARLVSAQMKCLPKAMALSRLLRSKRIGHTLVFAVRPSDMRGPADALHAWVELDGEKLIGDLPGPWVETLRLGAQ